MILAAALAATPVIAQTNPPPASEAAEPIDAQRLAAARTTVDQVWPIGTYERMMRGAMDQQTEQMTDAMFDMRLGDVVPEGADGKPLKIGEANRTMRETMAEADPHFEERMKITNRLIMNEMIPLMNRLEPGIREGLARAYARKFTGDQLGEMNRFFATATGGLYARESMAMWMDPEIASAIDRFMPEMVKEMPRIMDQVKAATAHLPPPPAPPARRVRD